MFISVWLLTLFRFPYLLLFVRTFFFLSGRYSIPIIIFIVASGCFDVLRVAMNEGRVCERGSSRGYDGDEHDDDANHHYVE